MSGPDILERLGRVIEQRHRERPDGSYVVELLDGGHAAIAAKLREESEELIEAAVSGDSAHTAREAADLLFHVLVLLEQAGVAPGAVWAELERRVGTSGLEEKASRTAPGEGESC
ncbi:MAG: phosphoribosyl-ATP diphosphatase [Myxococcota bacterium]|nr:phosphoribosyl-ATP diphosphatase [Myxococcota bacterium]